MPTCYLSLGSNLKSPKRQLQIAIDNLRRVKNTRISKISSLYFNPPVGVKSQPMFYNLVIEINTTLPAHELLKYCKNIEKKQGRVSKKRWGARTIDVDILLYGNKKLSTPNLIIPHPQMLKRDFVLIPLLEILPKITLPCGKIITDDTSSSQQVLDSDLFNWKRYRSPSNSTIINLENK
ncbi:MAG: 2-amino-4-hydroxy-6-hydroxymethyldihydropteridine diphosphokinase [Legionellaceae bacterium]|nr:2-amino-4-hydroxy-6-hydroxymethyldihydropteridine diphosphokinase [Legionellaceae bacterium]